MHVELNNEINNHSLLAPITIKFQGVLFIIRYRKRKNSKSADRQIFQQVIDTLGFENNQTTNKMSII